MWEFILSFLFAIAVYKFALLLWRILLTGEQSAYKRRLKRWDEFWSACEDITSSDIRPEGRL